MLYTFYVQSEENFIQFKSHVYHEVNSLVNKINVYENSEHEFSINSEAFNVQVSDNSCGIKFASEDYELELNYLLWFEVHHSEDRSSNLLLMMKLVAQIIKCNDGQCILFFNGCRPVLERKSREIIVDSKEFSNLFQDMGIEYIEGEFDYY